MQAANHNNSSRIGDSYYFLSNILYLAAQMNVQCRVAIEQEIERLKSQYQQQQQQQQQQPTTTKTSDLTAEQK